MHVSDMNNILLTKQQKRNIHELPNGKYKKVDIV